MDDDELPIGRFARLAGLTIGALRHYAEVGLLAPARVDPGTEYRYYQRAQLDRARSIARLRRLELTLDEIAEVLDDADGGADRLAVIRGRLESRTWQLQRAIHHLDQLIARKEPLVRADAPDPTLSPEQHQRLAAELFNFTWTLLEKAERTPAEIDTMLHAAHASRYHWGEASGSTPANLARGEWQCSRVYAVLGRGEPALWHARRCLEICEANGIGDWDIAFAYEALARASRVAGDREATEHWLATGRAAGDRIAEEDERQGFFADLATV